jgi:two-component system nitrate/nitrite response regulator NarL
MESKIRVMIVDDHPVVRRGIGYCLANEERVQIVAEASDGREALRKARALLPDVVIMDIDIPQMNGLAVTEVLKRELPQVKVLILSTARHGDCISRIFQSGACGYVLKEAAPEDVVKAVDAVQRGETFFSSDVAQLALNRFIRGMGPGSGSLLTNREQEVLTHIAEGLSNKEIACHLGVGVRTVETHREHVMQKLDIHTVAGLTKYAVSKGLIPLAAGGALA